MMTNIRKRLRFFGALEIKAKGVSLSPVMCWMVCITVSAYKNMYEMHINGPASKTVSAYGF